MTTTAPSSVSATSSSTTTAAVKESVIRKMTRLAHQYGAVNLSQGFPNEPPPRKLRLALAHSVLTGQEVTAKTTSSPITSSTPQSYQEYHEDELQQALLNVLQQQQQQSKEEGNAPFTESADVLNQYSPPMGRADLRQGIADYYKRFYNYQVSPDDVTVTLGATEAFASALRTVGRPGDKCVILEPFHEIYPSQCRIFFMEPLYVTLREDGERWTYDKQEFQQALSQAKILMLNSPHNPTGKVFSRDELAEIVGWCQQYNVTIITDEIYEHMCFGEEKHILIPQEFPEVAHQTLVCNSLGKSASATGWRLGWALHPPHLRETYRGIHDQMAVMSPHPMQYAALLYTSLPDAYFKELATRYHGRVQMLATVLQHVGFRVVFPQGAYYLFVNYRNVPALQDKDSMEAAMYLLREIGVACVPGDNFYGSSNDGQNYLRFAACRSDSDLEEASRRLQKLTHVSLPSSGSSK